MPPDMPGMSLSQVSTPWTVWPSDMSDDPAVSQPLVTKSMPWPMSQPLPLLPQVDQSIRLPFMPPLRMLLAPPILAPALPAVAMAPLPVTPSN